MRQHQHQIERGLPETVLDLGVIEDTDDGSSMTSIDYPESNCLQCMMLMMMMMKIVALILYWLKTSDNSALSLPPSRQILMGAAIVWQHCAIACCCMSAMLELLHGRVFQSPCNEVKRMLLLGQVTARTRQKLWLYS